MRLSPFGLRLVKAFEGFFAKPYRCPAGVLTQGYGHTAAAGPPALGGVWTEAQATATLERTIEARYAAHVRSRLKRTPTQAQFDALVSFAYNVGNGNFDRSSVLRHFNAGRDREAALAFLAWNKGGGRVLPGLTRRRMSEALVYQGVQDLDFDGKRDSGEPVYGAMAQDVDGDDTPEPVNRKPLARSRTLAGAGTGLLGAAAAAKGALDVMAQTAEQVRQVTEQIGDAKDAAKDAAATAARFLAPETWLWGGIIGVTLALAVVIYARLDDHGVWPWSTTR